MRGIGIPLMLLLVCGAVAGQVPAEEAARAAARSNTAFAADLYAALRSRDGNLFFSPYSVSTALAMTRQGAKGGTAAQIDRVFHWEPGVTPAHHVALAKALRPGMRRDGFGKMARIVPAHEIHIANALWAQEGLAVEKPFAAVLEGEFGAPLRRLDFRQSAKAREVVNAWVAEQTKKRIQNIVPEGLPTPDTLFALANAIWFKAAWHQPFQERFTKEAPFHTADGREVSVPLMHRTENFRYAEDDD
ncbi:MAG: serpin family protein, partial [Planctomycetota bacterium]